MDEYISREEAIKALYEVYEHEYPTASGDFDEYARHDVQNILNGLPAADVQPVRYGKWISHGGNSYECSNCHKMIYNAKDMREHAFCGTCGSKNGR